jgi:hypothetical protein
LKNSLSDTKTKHIALSCGVYGDQTNKTPIDVFAAAIKTDDGNIYIALTIKASAGHEEDSSCYGLNKVAILSKEIGQKLLELIVDITPIYDWDDLALVNDSSNSSQKENSYESNAIESNTVKINLESTFGDTLIDNTEQNSNRVEVQHELKLDHNSLQCSTTKSDEGETWKVMPTPPSSSAFEEFNIDQQAQDRGTSKCEFKSEEIISDPSELSKSECENSLILPLKEDDSPTTKTIVGRNRLKSSGFESDDPNAAENDQVDTEVHTNEPYNFGRVLSVAKVGAARSFLPNLKRKNSLEYAWSAEDEKDEGLPHVTQTSIELDLTSVVTHYCSSNCFVINTLEESTVFTGTLKMATTANKYMIENNKIFEWMRGPAASG